MHVSFRNGALSQNPTILRNFNDLPPSRIKNSIYFPLLIPLAIMLIIQNPFDPGMVLITICPTTIIIMIIIFVINKIFHQMKIP